MMTVDQILADNRKMERFICDRLRTERTRIVLASGWPPDGPVWVDLTLYLCDDGDHELVIESNEPDAFGVRDVYEHFRRQERTSWEREREIQDEMNRWKVHDLEREIERQREDNMANSTNDSLAEQLSQIEDKLDTLLRLKEGESARDHSLADDSTDLPDCLPSRIAAKLLGVDKKTLEKLRIDGFLKWRVKNPSSSRKEFLFEKRSVLELKNGYRVGDARPTRPNRRRKATSSYVPQFIKLD